MTPSELFKAGKLNEAIAEQLTLVKASPSDQTRRLFFFELLAFNGEWDRARKQIEFLESGDPKVIAAVQSYRALLDAETERAAVLAGKMEPRFLTPPPEHARLRLEAIKLLAAGDEAGASALLTQAAEQSPDYTGEINGKPFELLRDADDLFGPILEVIGTNAPSEKDSKDAKYYFWVPLDHIERLSSNAPATPRDLIWLPGRIDLHNNSSGEIFVPALYPGSYKSDNAEIKLGRLTDWRELAGGSVLGLGLKTLLLDDDAIGVLDIRDLAVNPPPGADEALASEEAAEESAGETPSENA